MHPGWVLFAALCLVASVLVPAGGPVSDAQDQTSWYVNDNPSLRGPSQYWWAGDAGKGYGSNNYVYTYAIAGESSADNWASWSMGRRVGRQEIQVYVPNTRATATVLYRIDIGGSRYSKRVAQRNAYGWTALGIYDVDGASVTITLRDNDASQHWNRDGYASSSIGVDAAAMRCVSRCSTTQPTPAPTAAPTPRVQPPGVPEILGAVVGVDSIGVAWSPPSSDGGSPITGYRVDLYRNGSRVDRKSVSASTDEVTFRGLAANTAYQVRVSARNSAGLGAAASADTSTAPDDVPVDVTDRDPEVVVPSRPRSVRASADTGSIGVAWSPPSNDGGAPVSGYRVDLYRGSTRVERKPLSGSARSASFTGLAANTDYQVRVSAQNSAGSGPAAVANIRTQRQESGLTVPSEPRNVRAGEVGENRATVLWDPPSSNGGSPITGYQVELFRGGSRVGIKTTFPSTRSTTFNNLSPDTDYTVLISAINAQGFSTPEVADFRTDPRRDGSQIHVIHVHLCSSPNAGYNDASLQAQVTSFNNRGISSFFDMQSGGLAAFHFVKGKIHQVDMQGDTHIQQLHERAKNSNRHPCDLKAADLVQQNQQQILMLVDVSPSAWVWGYAPTKPNPSPTGYYSTGRVTAPTVAKFTDSGRSQGQYDALVAHELGHSVFAFRHTADREINGRTFSGDAPEVRGSLMNHFFRGVRGLDDVRVFCVNRVKVNWTCDPNAPDPFGISVGSGAQRKPVAPTAPSSPRNVSAVAHGERQIRVSWSPPSGSGGSAISHYLVRYSRPAIGSSGPWASATRVATGTSHTSVNLRYGVTYTVEVTAVNQGGHSSEPVQTTATTNRATAAPSSPRNVRAEAYGERQIRVSWSPPSGSGGSAISHYLVRYSRPAIGSSGPWASATRVATGTSHTSVNLRYGVTYTVEVTAVNQAGHSSEPVQTTATTNRAPAAPSSPRNVRAEAYGERQIRVSWSPPSGSGGSAISHYVVRYSRPAIGSSGPWASATRVATGTSHTSVNLRYGVTYTVEVTAVNRNGQASAAATTSTTTSRIKLDAPEVFLEPEGRSWTSIWLDDPDLVVKWTANREATGYNLDWRYVEYDIDALRTAMNQDDQSAVDKELEGREVSAAKINNKFKPIPKEYSEVRCEVEKRNPYNNNNRIESYCIWGSGYRTFERDEPHFRIDSVNQGYNLQVRVRALASSQEKYQYHGEWSDWVYVNNEWLGLVCSALDVYENVQDIKTAAEIAGWAILVGAVIVTAATAGAAASSLGAAAAAKVALSAAAKVAVKHLIKRVVLKKMIKDFIKEAAKEIAKQVVADSVKSHIRYVFGCIQKAGNLSNEEIIVLGQETIRELGSGEPNLVTFDIDGKDFLKFLGDTLGK